MENDDAPAATAASASQVPHPTAPGRRERARRALGRLAERARRGAKHYTREAVEEAVIDLAPLPRELRVLTGAGYIILGALLIAVLATELAGDRLPGVTFHNGSEVVRVPAAVLP